MQIPAESYLRLETGTVQGSCMFLDRDMRRYSITFRVYRLRVHRPYSGTLHALRTITGVTGVVQQRSRFVESDIPWPVNNIISHIASSALTKVCTC